MGRKFDYDLIERLSRQQYSIGEVCEMVGCGPTTVSVVRHDRLIEKSKPRPVYDHAEIERLLKQEHPDGEIASKIGCDKRTVQRVKHKLGLTEPQPELPPFEERLAKVKPLLDEGMSIAQVAEQVHIHRDKLYKLFPEYKWDHTQISKYARMVRQLDELPDRLERKALR